MSAHQDTSETEWTPLRAELPLEPLDAFRLASFGIEYVPRYGLVYWDRAACGSWAAENVRQGPSALEIDGHLIWSDAT